MSREPPHGDNRNFPTIGVNVYNPRHRIQTLKTPARNISVTSVRGEFLSLLRGYIFIVACNLVVCPAGFGATFQEIQLTTNTADESNILIEGDTAERLHIVYAREGGIYYQCRHFEGPGLVPEEWVTFGSNSSLALDPAGNPHVLSVSSGTVYYASRTNGGWSAAAVGSADSASLAIMEDGQPYVAYSVKTYDADDRTELVLGRIETDTLIPLQLLADGIETNYNCHGTYAGEHHDFTEPRLRCSNGIFHVVARHVRKRDAAYSGQYLCTAENDERLGYWRYAVNGLTNTFSKWSYYHYAISSEKWFLLTGSNQPQLVVSYGGGRAYCSSLNPWVEDSLSASMFMYATGVGTIDATSQGVIGMVVGYYYGGTNLLHIRTGGVFSPGVPVTTQGFTDVDLCLEYAALATIQSKTANSNEVYLMVNIDLDGDGIGDGWEQRHYGSLTNAMGEAHSDGDPLSDREEYIAGTDPFDSNSVFQVEGLAADSGMSTALRIKPGARARFYTLYLTTNMGLSWTNPPELTDLPGQGVPIDVPDPLAGLSQAWFKATAHLAP